MGILIGSNTLYINGTDGYVLSDSGFNKIFEDCTSQVDELYEKINALETTVDTKISDAKTAILNEAATAVSEDLEARIGDIPAGTTIKAYIDGLKST